MNNLNFGAGTAIIFKGVFNIIPVEKNKEYTVKITDISSDGNGIAHIEGYTIFVAHAAPEEMVRILVVKVKSNFGYGKIVEILTPSPYRVTPQCTSFPKCGGCDFCHIAYEQQLVLKKSFVDQCFLRIGGFKDFQTTDIYGMDNPVGYRNKMVFPFGLDKNGAVEYGFFRERSHEIIPFDDCMLGNPINKPILEVIKNHMQKYAISPYDERSHTGMVRRAFIRKSYHTDEMMVVISSNSRTLPHCDTLIRSLRECDDHIMSIILNVNQGKNNLVLGDTNILLFGEPVIHDFLCGLEYEISPNSFFQVNPVQTEKLYQTALDFADIKKTDTVLDVYCGIGTISLAASKYAKHVTGIEIVPQAIENAKQNALRNHIKNADFYAEDAKIIVPQFIEQGKTFNAVILDPPRKGSDENTLSAIAAANPDRIVYISCNPSTLARDMKFLTQYHYTPQKSIAVDLFPFTTHVETVVLLSRKRPDDKIEIDLELDELDITSAESKATYDEIKAYVLEKYNLKVSSLYISQVKRKLGLEVGKNYNPPKSENPVVPTCPPEKEKAITDALRYFGMI